MTDKVTVNAGYGLKTRFYILSQAELLIRAREQRGTPLTHIVSILETDCVKEEIKLLHKIHQ